MLQAMEKKKQTLGVDRARSRRSATLGELARAVEGRLALGDPEAVARGVSTDSRTVNRGEAFVAIKGERFDGHDFVLDAQTAGAAVAIVNESRFADVIAGARRLPLIVVPDTADALLRLAASVRAASEIPWVGVTGSAGKTTTKEFAAAALRPLGPVLKAPASFNNRVGVPLTILGLCGRHRAAVVELGTGGPGEMRELAETARPDVGIVTGIGPAHLGRFVTLDAVAKEKAEMLRAMPADGVAVLPVECEGTRILRDAAPGEIVTFGFARGANIRAEGVELRADGTSAFSVDGVDVGVRLPGRVNVLNALAALAAAKIVGVSLREAAERLAEVKPLALRGRVREQGGLRVIEDCYNANPMSFRAALDNLAAMTVARRAAIGGDSRAWVVAGDMRELGGASARFHEELGREIAEAGAEFVLAVGEFAGDVIRGARRAGIPDDATEVVADAREAAARARKMARNGDVVLVKGSRAVGLEMVVEALLASGD